MNYLLPGDLFIIDSLQNMGGWLTPVMKFFTWLGYPHSYMILIAIVYWSVDRKLGLRLALFLPFVASINTILKQAIHAPRPYWLDRNIIPFRDTGGFGMPSGHAQASAVWIYTAILLKRGWFWIVSIVVVLMVGLSRVYLGVHFPSQVVAGWMIGILMALLFIRFESVVIQKLIRLNLRDQLAVVILISLILSLLGAVFVILLKGWEIPAEWIRNSVDDFPGRDETILSSAGFRSIAGNVGGFLGTGMGAIFSHRTGGFENRGRWWSRILRCLIGLPVIFLIYGAFQLITPDHTKDLLLSIWQFCGFFCISVSAIFLIPSLLIRINLLSKAKG